MLVRESVKVGDKVITLETGRIAKQADGAVLVTSGETVVLVTAVGAKEARPGTNFMPLTVDYIEKTHAAGKIPGGFFKREGKLRDSEVLTSRLIDRPCRPLFPDAYYKDVQIIATVHSADGENPSDVLAMIGASAALHISPIPWGGPIAGVRIGRIDGEFVANPTFQELEESDMDILLAGTRDAIMMVEGEGDEISEADMLAALQFGHEAIQGVITLIEKIRDSVGKPKREHIVPEADASLVSRVRELGLEKTREACNITEKHARYDRFAEVKREIVEALAEEFPEREGEIKDAYEALRYNTMREQILTDRRRVDGRDLKTVRPIDIEVGFLPRTHGSSLFTRGETQAIVTATLGTRQDEQRIDGLIEEYWKSFILHYNFPPYSVGETRPMRGPGRREVGHGNLAERALKKMMPDREEFPYTVRVVSEITESNGSSSMATVCGGSLALMDAGVPLKSAVAGVAMGLIMEGERYAVLTDILGDEDHLGDMDFKVCGTEKGITAIQMDIKVAGLSAEILDEALDQAREGRLHILDKMNEVLDAPRSELNRHAPRITTLKVKPDQIRLIIGPGGKMIKAIVDQTGVKIDVSDDGTVAIASPDAEAVQKAIAIVESLTTEPEIGAKYTGVVRRVERYGVFLEIAPGTDGLLHITDMSWDYVENVEDLFKLGDEVEVIISDIDREGRIRLNRKELLEKPADYDSSRRERPAREDRPRREERSKREERPRREERRSSRRDEDDGNGEERPRREERRGRRDESRSEGEERPRRDESRSAGEERPRRDDERRARRRGGGEESVAEDEPRSSATEREERDEAEEREPRKRRERGREERPRRARSGRSREERDFGDDESSARESEYDEERPRRVRTSDEDRPRRSSRFEDDDDSRRARRHRDDRDDDAPRRSREDFDEPETRVRTPRRAEDDERPRRARRHREDDPRARRRDREDEPRRTRSERDEEERFERAERPRRARRDEDEVLDEPRPRRGRGEERSGRRSRDERYRDDDREPVAGRAVESPLIVEPDADDDFPPRRRRSRRGYHDED